MALYAPTNSPEQNLDILAANPYPGRLLVVGFVGDTAMLGYAITGRSEGSRNRRLLEEYEIVSTEVDDPSLPVGDPELTIYDAMRGVGDYEIVSNGNQTDRVVRYLRAGSTIERALEATDYEPDAPNFTPRITGFHHFDADKGEPYFGLSVINKDLDSISSVRRLYTNLSPEITIPDSDEPFAYAVHTYKGDGNPLPAFDEAPFRIPVSPNANAYSIAGMLWETLNRDNRVAVAVKRVDVLDTLGMTDSYIINRHEPVGSM